MTNNEIIYKVKEQTDKHSISSSTGWSDQDILFYALSVRNLFIARKFKQTGRVSKSNEMTTPCMKLITAVNCPCVVPNGCEALMTEELLPDDLTGIISVTNPDNSKEYSPTSSNLAKHRSRQRIKSFADRTSYFEQNMGEGTRLYIISEKPLKYVKVTMVPKDPEEIQRMTDCDGNNIYKCTPTFDLEWLADPELNQVVIDTTINNLFGSRSTVTDLKNNGIDDNINNKEELIGTNS